MSKNIYIVTDCYDAGDAWEPMDEFVVNLVGIYSSREEADKKAKEYGEKQYPYAYKYEYSSDDPVGTIKVTKAILGKTYFDGGKVIETFSYYNDSDDDWDDWDD